MHVPTRTTSAQPQKAIRLNELKDHRLVDLYGALNSLFLLIRDSIILITMLYTHIGPFIYRAQRILQVWFHHYPHSRDWKMEALSHLYKQEVLRQLFKNYLVCMFFQSLKTQLQLQ